MGLSSTLRVFLMLMWDAGVITGVEMGPVGDIPGEYVGMMCRRFMSI